MQSNEKLLITYKSISNNRSTIYDEKTYLAPEILISKNINSIIEFYKAIKQLCIKYEHKTPTFSEGTKILSIISHCMKLFDILNSNNEYIKFDDELTNHIDKYYKLIENKIAKLKEYMDN